VMNRLSTGLDSLECAGVRDEPNDTAVPHAVEVRTRGAESSTDGSGSGRRACRIVIVHGSMHLCMLHDFWALQRSTPGTASRATRSRGG
jgi:hypothetical protein